MKRSGGHWGFGANGCPACGNRFPYGSVLKVYCVRGTCHVGSHVGSHAGSHAMSVGNGSGTRLIRCDECIADD